MSGVFKIPPGIWREALAIIREQSRFYCDGSDLGFWKPPRGMSLVQGVLETCISRKSHRKCMGCRAKILREKVGA